MKSNKMILVISVLILTSLVQAGAGGPTELSVDVKARIRALEGVSRQQTERLETGLISIGKLHQPKYLNRNIAGDLAELEALKSGVSLDEAVAINIQAWKAEKVRQKNQKNLGKLRIDIPGMVSLPIQSLIECLEERIKTKRFQVLHQPQSDANAKQLLKDIAKDKAELNALKAGYSPERASIAGNNAYEKLFTDTTTKK